MAQHLRILVVEDEPQIREVLEEFLAGRGHDVVPAASGSEALSLVDRGPTFDVALVDWHLPGIAGRDVVDSISERSPETAIIITTGRIEPGLRRASVAARSVTILEKPFSLHTLGDWVERAVSVWRRRRAGERP